MERDILEKTVGISAEYQNEIHIYGTISPRIPGSENVRCPRSFLQVAKTKPFQEILRKAEASS